MKQRAYFRIICLKNEDNKKYIDEKTKKNNIVITNNGNLQRNKSQDIIPNLVHLSARIQNDALQDQNNPYSNCNHLQSPNNIPQHHFRSEDIFFKKKQVEEKRQSFIKRYLQSKHTSLSKQKHTMKNLIGQITFSTNKNRQKKISKLIKQTIDQASLSKKIKKKKPLQDPYSQSLSENRLSLQEDFHTFLMNKQKQFIRDLQPKLEDTEQYKLKKLLIVNPEREDYADNSSKQKHLNLFHFVSSGKDRGTIPRIKPRVISSSNSKQINPAWSRIDKRLLKNSNLKTQEEQFQWSRIKGNNPRSFIFKTIDP